MCHWVPERSRYTADAPVIRLEQEVDIKPINGEVELEESDDEEDSTVRTYSEIYADGTLYVESNVECEAVTLSLYDPAGRLIVQYADATLHTGDNTWPVEQARQGVYLLQVRMSNGTTDVIRIAAK